MAYFAKLGVGDVVETVIAVSDDIATSEQAGADFLNTTLKMNSVWKQTSTTHAGIGWKFDRYTGLFSCPPAIPTE